MTTTQFAITSEIYRVPMRDGVALSVHVHRPAAEGTFPAIIEYTPYQQGPLGSPHPIVEHGYATVTFDIRGTGNSEGWNDSIYCAATRQDGYDMVEWAAAQPWCNGKVGMWGISYSAVVTLLTAMMAPPHLHAVIVRSGTDDPYTEWTNPGGSPRPYMYQVYAPIMTASNFSPPDPAEVGDRWMEIWQERIAHNVPWGIGFIEHLEDDPFWRERSLRDRYERIQCPVFVVEGWADWYATPLLRTFEQLSVPKRALIGPWSHRWPDAALPGPRIDWLHESLKWFDHWLKDEDTGVMREPPVTLFIREYTPPATLLTEDRGAFRAEMEWPPARHRDTLFYLCSGGRLSLMPETGDGCGAFAYDPRRGAAAGMHGGGPFSTNWLMPLDQRADDAQSLVYTSEPLDEPLEVIGLPRVDLAFSSSSTSGLIVVKLCDVAPDGTSVLVTKGYLHVSHRDSHSDPSPVEPGTTYPLEISLLACAYRFLEGHRVRISISGGDLLNLWPVGTPGTGYIHHCDAVSRLVLPVIHDASPALPAPDLKLVNELLPTRASLRPPGSLAISHDPIHDTATVDLVAHFNSRWINTAHYAVSAQCPAEVALHAESRYEYAYDGRQIVVDARCNTNSTEDTFRHAVDLTITLDDEPFIAQHWEATVPRRTP